MSDLIGQSFNNTVPVTSIWPIFRCANTFIKVDFPAPLEEKEEEEDSLKTICDLEFSEHLL